MERRWTKVAPLKRIIMSLSELVGRTEGKAILNWQGIKIESGIDLLIIRRIQWLGKEKIWVRRF